MAGIKIVNYTPKHQPYFERFNRDWIEKYFWLEEIDKYVLCHPDGLAGWRGVGSTKTVTEFCPAGVTPGLTQAVPFQASGAPPMPWAWFWGLGASASAPSPGRLVM